MQSTSEARHLVYVREVNLHNKLDKLRKKLTVCLSNMGVTRQRREPCSINIEDEDNGLVHVVFSGKLETKLLCISEN